MINGHGKCPGCGAGSRPPEAGAARESRFSGARLLTVIQVGTVEGDPLRQVVRYLTPTGEVLATYDPLLEERRSKP